MIIPPARVYFPEEDIEIILDKVKEILSTGWLTLGKYNKEFEEKFSKYVGTKYAIATNSGTSALEILLRCINVKDSSVIVPTNTFFATPASVIHAGGKVIFADITDNLCIDPESVNEAIRKDTKAIIVVHIGGIVPPQIEEIIKICEEYNLYLIEDAAHAHGSEYKSKKAGSFGIGGAFSFYPTKVITSGEGGMITTDSEDIYKKAIILRDQGKAGFYGNVHVDMGYNWRMSEIHAIIGLTQFSRLEEFIEKRQRIAKTYDRELKKIDVKPLKIPRNVRPNYYKYIAFIDEDVDRSKIKKELKERYNIGLSGEVYELPCHLQPIFKKLYGFKGGEFPIAEELCKRHICLPIYPTMSKDEVRYVVECLGEVMR